jgi:DNA-binding IclR family transcriptional regulator
MPVHSNREQVEARMRQAEADALTAAAQVYRNAMTEELQGGYTSGAFYSGMQGIAGSVAVSEPQRDPQGAYIVVGTNVVYGKHWAT